MKQKVLMDGLKELKGEHMNRVVLMGRLTKDIDYKGNENNSVAKFTVATNRPAVKQGQASDFINCVAFGKTADFMNGYFHKGMRICLEGRILTGSYEKQDGTKVYTTEVCAERVEFCEPKQEDAKAEPTNNSNSFMQFAEVEDEGLPFNR